MDGLTFSDRTVGVDKGAEWHEQLNSFLMKHNLSVLHKLMLKQLLTQPSSSTLSNSAVTVHHLALLYTGLYSLSTSMLSTCLLSDVFQIEGCSAGLDVDATVCMWTQGDGWIPKGRIGCVRFATHLRT